MQDDPEKEVLRINYGPLKQVMVNTGRSMAIGMSVAGIGIFQILGVVMTLLFAGFTWWLSEQAYEVTWLLGFPLRLVALVTGVGALFAIIGGALYIVGLTVYGLIAMVKAMLRGKR